MRRNLVVDDDLHTRLAIRTPLKRCGFRVAIAGGSAKGLAALRGATRCLRRPFRPATLLGGIDECLSDAEPHRRYAATLPPSRPLCPNSTAQRHRDISRKKGSLPAELSEGSPRTAANERLND